MGAWSLRQRVYRILCITSTSNTHVHVPLDFSVGPIIFIVREISISTTCYFSDYKFPCRSRLDSIIIEDSLQDYWKQLFFVKTQLNIEMIITSQEWWITGTCWFQVCYMVWSQCIVVHIFQSSARGVSSSCIRCIQRINAASFWLC